ncbi:MAG: arylsulfatase [Planctomycetales bacterium]|nr:arylsulfatase [Planctomycetales bacterium]
MIHVCSIVGVCTSAVFRGAAVLLALIAATRAIAAERPNVVLIYADDLGYGDLSCYGATKVQTPNIDRLAKSGRLFADAHSPSAVCTPSRYGLLTGEYPWRIGSRSPVFAQHGLIVDPNKTTLADIFQKAGYSTACIGKWHLGFGDSHPDWNAELKPGPLEMGFDYYYGVPVVNSHPPFVYVENHRVVGWDSDDPFIYAHNKPNPHSQPFPEKNTQPMRSGLGFSGGKAAHALYRDEHVATRLTEKAIKWMETQQDKPFFLYLATTNIHHPFTPHPRFHGTSQAGLYGDFIHELDWTVGEVTKTLEKMGLADDTLVIFTSDNGGMLNGGGTQAWERGHRLNGELQGFKFGVWEGGHRVPFIVRWPKHVAAGSRSDALLSSLDLMASLATLLDVKLQSNEARDSIDQSPVLFGERTETLRRELMLQPHQLSHLGLRSDDWVYIPARGSGGFGNGQGSLKKSGNVNSDFTAEGEFKPDAPTAQLYNLQDDPRQQRNVIGKHPEVARKLSARLEELKSPAAFEPLGDLRFDFESGDLQGWRVIDGEFEKPVDSSASLPRHPDRPFGRQGQFHLSTLATKGRPGASDQQTGTIESPRFRLKGDKIAFLIGGGFRDDVHLAVFDADGNEIARTGGDNGPRMVRRVIELPQQTGQILYLRLVDQAKAGWGHLVFDDFSADGELLVEDQR